MGSTENTVANTKFTRHSSAGRNPAAQPEGMDPGLHRGDELEKQVRQNPSPPTEGERQGEGR